MPGGALAKRRRKFPESPGENVPVPEIGAAAALG
jgi:hypothetical protein